MTIIDSRDSAGRLVRDAENDQPKQDLPTVRVIPVTIPLAAGDEPREWFACCTETVWLQAEGLFSRGCNWYGEYRGTVREARNDAARHRRAHAVMFQPGQPCRP